MEPLPGLGGDRASDSARTAASGCKALASCSQALALPSTKSMLKQLILTAFAASAFAPTQRLSGRAFGASSKGYKHAGRFVAMPTLAVQSAATPRSGAEELCKKLSSTVAGTLGKPESYVMVTFQKVDAMCYTVRKSTRELG